MEVKWGINIFLNSVIDVKKKLIIESLKDMENQIKEKARAKKA